jgi:NAD(P)-dependent dehydrogenase (short-subunit alcohol dehydrogenase family)
MTVGPYLCSAAFVHLLAAAGTKGPVKRPGNIINISSLSGLTKWSQNGQFAYNVGPYTASSCADPRQCAKAAVIQLSKLMATDLCAEEIGIRVNNLAPGYFSTELTTGTASTNGKSSWPIDEFKAEMKRVHSNADRPGTDTEMGSVRIHWNHSMQSWLTPNPQGILFLATNDYVNGHTLLIDGGLLLRHP